MGTSASSKGPGAGVSFDPPWLDEIDVPGQNKQDNVNPATGIAPKARGICPLWEQRICKEIFGALF